jgi:hypothetical protein
MALLAQNRILGVWSGRGPLRDPSGSVAVLLLAAWIAGIGGRLGRGGR